MNLNNNDNIRGIRGYIDLVRDLLKNKKYRSITILCLWFLAILIFAMFIRANSSLNKGDNVNSFDRYNNNGKEILTEQDVKTLIQNISGYDFEYFIDGNFLLKGTLVNNRYDITYNDVSYYGVDGIIYLGLDDSLVELIPFPVNIFNLSVSSISNLIKNCEMDYLTNYKDGKYKAGFKIRLADFLLTYDSKIVDSDNYVEIGVIINNNSIVSIELDTRYVNEYYMNSFGNSITLNLSNIRNNEV